MLISAAADSPQVLARALVWTACVCSMLLVGSFALFARDQVSAGSKHQQGLLVAAAPGTPAPVTHRKGQPRRFIDGAAGVLISPFRSIVASDSDWVNHGIPTIFALLLYGGGFGYLARYSRGLA
jgi:hypothetical protein